MTALTLLVGELRCAVRRPCVSRMRFVVSIIGSTGVCSGVGRATRCPASSRTCR